jgi:hypothetical protein
VLPRLRAGFLFEGCRRGVLFASHHDEPSLDNLVSTLWDLAAWARRPWHPAGGLAEALSSRARARARRERWLRAALVLLLLALVLWSWSQYRSGWTIIDCLSL